MKAQYVILVVDDEPAVRLALAKTLETEDYTVLTARDGDEAVEVARVHTPDLILCDYAMPGMNGVEVCQILAEMCPDTVRILITGYAQLDMAMAAINDGGVYKFVQKPWHNRDLIVMVQRALEHYELVREGKVLVEMLEMAHRQQQVKVRGLEDQVARYRRILGMEELD